MPPHLLELQDFHFPKREHQVLFERQLATSKRPHPLRGTAFWGVLQ